MRLKSLFTYGHTNAFLKLRSYSNNFERSPGFFSIIRLNNPPANAGDMGSIPRSERYPEEENGNSLKYACLGNPWIEEPNGYSP